MPSPTFRFDLLWQLQLHLPTDTMNGLVSPGCQLRSCTITQQAATAVKKRSQPSGSERRTGARFACGLEAICQVGSAAKGMPARVIDISAGGIGLILKNRFKEGDQ